MPNAIEIEGLQKIYPPPGGRRAGTPGKEPNAPPAGVVALAQLDLTVADGAFFGLLGPNGAGKTTTIGILTTRVRPTGGTARVAGADVVRQSSLVRQRIGVVPQRPNPDRALSVLDNLVFHAAYFGINRTDGVRQARRLLDRFAIGAKAESKVDELSGGQQQRLMIARALIHEPSVIFLDEPTVGLDPQARLDLWEILRELHAQGRTIVLTTHYMEEADRLCERIAIVDHGRLLAVDTPAGLKARAPGGTLIELALDEPANGSVDALRALPSVERVESKGTTLRVHALGGSSAVAPVLGVLGAAGRQVRSIQLAEPSLETLFIALTGRRLD